MTHSNSNKVYLIQWSLLGEWWHADEGVSEDEIARIILLSTKVDATTNQVKQRLFGGFKCYTQNGLQPGIHIYHNAGAYTYCNSNGNVDPQSRKEMWKELICKNKEAPPVKEGAFTEDFPTEEEIKIWLSEESIAEEIALAEDNKTSIANWTDEEWSNAVFCEKCGMPLIPVETEATENGTIGTYECKLCKANQIIDELQKENTCLYEAAQWIPVEKQRPDQDQNEEEGFTIEVEIKSIDAYGRELISTGYLNPYNEWFDTKARFFAESEITHWRPLWRLHNMENQEVKQ